MENCNLHFSALPEDESKLLTEVLQQILLLNSITDIVFEEIPCITAASMNRINQAGSDIITAIITKRSIPDSYGSIITGAIDRFSAYLMSIDTDQPELEKDTLLGYIKSITPDYVRDLSRLSKNIAFLMN